MRGCWSLTRGQFVSISSGRFGDACCDQDVAKKVVAWAQQFRGSRKKRTSSRKLTSVHDQRKDPMLPRVCVGIA